MSSPQDDAAAVAAEGGGDLLPLQSSCCWNYWEERDHELETWWRGEEGSLPWQQWRWWNSEKDRGA